MQLRGVRGIVDLAQLLDRHVRVDLRGGERLVTQERLDEPGVGAVLQHVGRAGVAQQVSRARLLDPRERHVPAHPLGDVLRRHRQSVVGQEQRFTVADRELRPGFLQVLLDPRRRALPDRDHAIFPALALAHHHESARGVDVVEREARQLHAPQRRRVKGFEHGAITQARRRDRLGLAQDRLDLLDG